MRTTTTVNAGSMADIAFLMLIFFLTTTTIETDKGLSQTLPDPCLEKDCTTDIAQRNLLAISINKDGQYLVNQKLIDFEELSQEIIDFVSNKDELISMPVTPDKAIVNIELSRELDYESYIKVLDGVKQAYAEMRTDYSKAKFSKDLSDLSDEELMQVLDAFPLNLGESEPEKR